MELSAEYSSGGIFNELQTNIGTVKSSYNQILGHIANSVYSESDCRTMGHKFDSGPGPNIIPWRLITVILLLQLIQEGLLSVTSYSICTKLTA